jgi:hypothetical protein
MFMEAEAGGCKKVRRPLCLLLTKLNGGQEGWRKLSHRGCNGRRGGRRITAAWWPQCLSTHPDGVLGARNVEESITAIDISLAHDGKERAVWRLLSLEWGWYRW